MKSRFWASGLLALAFASVAPASDEDDLKFFEARVRPVLATSCYGCHSAKAEKLKGELRLDSRDAMLKGGQNGPAIVPGSPEKSRLVAAVRYADKDLQMPPKSKLPDAAIADLITWIKKGAPWPKEAAPAGGPASTSTYKVPDYEKLRREHWAWQPVKKASAPAVKDAAWPLDDIDRFVLAKLEEKGLKPAAPAERAALLRRLSFDLTGLPPTPEELQAFIADTSKDACGNVVDRLLASPRFGERWGRHWLDVARYAESTGSTRNYPYPHAWRYRDYVIASFNADKPYDQFLREQLAGDLMTGDTPARRDELHIATGFLALGVKDLNEQNNEQFIMDLVDDQIDTVGRSILATTLGCARCHDHKFDPIPTRDYYALAGIFRSTTELAGVTNRKGGGKGKYDTGGLVALEAAPAEPLLKPRAEERPNKKKAKKKVEVNETAGPSAMGVKDGKAVEAHICIQGEVEHPGAAVPRGVLSLIAPPRPLVFNDRSSGRLELAEWIASRSNPLTARVMANRVWQHLMGEGLVTTVDNFGVTGDKPSHPELLDHLAQRFMDSGWSVKKLVRAIVLSRTYQLGSQAVPANLEADPGNRLLWRIEPRRIDAEAIRDAILAAAGKLDLLAPRGSLAGVAPDQQIQDGKNSVSGRVADDVHRSVYLPIVRDQVPDMLQVFDFVDPGTIAGRRDTTTVATQALLLLNSRFVVAQSRAFADRLKGDDAARVDAAYLVALSRPPSEAERKRALTFVSDHSATSWAAFGQALIASAEFRYVNFAAPSASEGHDVRR